MLLICANSPLTIIMDCVNTVILSNLGSTVLCFGLSLLMCVSYKINVWKSKVSWYGRKNWIL